jgi:hypothetical protein
LEPFNRFRSAVGSAMAGPAVLLAELLPESHIGMESPQSVHNKALHGLCNRSVSDNSVRRSRAVP